MAQPPLPQQHRQPPLAQTHIHQRRLNLKKKKKHNQRDRHGKKTQPNQTNPHPKSNKPKSKTHHCRPIKRNPMVGGSDDMVDGTTSSAAWRGMVIKPWVVVDVVGRVCVAVLVDGDLRV